MQDAAALQALSALSNRTRMEIFRLLASGEGQTPTAIARAVGIGPSVASYHLYRLLRANLVNRVRKDGRSIYSAEPDMAREVLRFVRGLPDTPGS